MKIPSGGWFPLVIGLVVFTIMTTWRAGRRLVATRLASETVPLASFLATCEEAAEARVSCIAVFLTAQTELVLVTLLRKLKHNKVLHWTVLLVRVITENIPEWQAQTGLRHVRSAAVFGRSRRILALPRRRTSRGSSAGRTSRGWNSIQATCPFSSGVPTSNRPHGPGWHGGTSAFIPASRALPRGRPISSASHRTGSSNSASRSRYDGLDHNDAWFAGRASSLRSSAGSSRTVLAVTGRWGGPIDAMGRAARDGNFVAVSNRWSASDAPAERLEQVPRRPGPK